MSMHYTAVQLSNGLYTILSHGCHSGTPARETLLSHSCHSGTPARELRFLNLKRAHGRHSPKSRLTFLLGALAARIKPVHTRQVRALLMRHASSLLAPQPAGPQPAKALLPPLLGALAARLVLVHARQLKRVRVIHALQGRQPRRRRRVLCGVLYHRAELTRLLSPWSFASEDDAGPNMVTMYLKTW